MLESNDCLHNSLATIFGAQTAAGNRDGGVYIQVGMGHGFYIPKADHELALARANETRQVQFVGLAVDGTAIHGAREELLYNPSLAGYIAWVFPDGRRDRR